MPKVKTAKGVKKFAYTTKGKQDAMMMEKKEKMMMEKKEMKSKKSRMMTDDGYMMKK